MISPRIRVIFAVVLLVLCLVGWPLSALTWARSEPPTVLGLSWAAMIVAALTLLATTDVRAKQEDDQ